MTALLFRLLQCQNLHGFDNELFLMLPDGSTVGGFGFQQLDVSRVYVPLSRVIVMILEDIVGRLMICS